LASGKQVRSWSPAIGHFEKWPSCVPISLSCGWTLRVAALGMSAATAPTPCALQCSKVGLRSDSVMALGLTFPGQKSGVVAEGGGGRALAYKCSLGEGCLTWR